MLLGYKIVYLGSFNSRVKPSYQYIRNRKKINMKRVTYIGGDGRVL